jgi:hypothetical protein
LILLSDNIIPICLPFTKNIQTNFPPKVIATGFGYTENFKFNDQNFKSNVMLSANLPYYPLDKCAEKYKNSKVIFDESIFCAGGEGNSSVF